MAHYDFEAFLCGTMKSVYAFLGVFNRIRSRLIALYAVRKTMIQRLLPFSATNDYRGHPLAKWVFVALTVITIGRSLAHMFAEDGGAGSIASITLDAFGPGGANTVITIFALWGLSQLIIGLIYLVVFWRYQSLIPLMYVFFVFEYVMRLIAPAYSPGLETLETPPGAIVNLIFIPLGLVMLVLSLRDS